jgi:hypothetical protein
LLRKVGKAIVLAVDITGLRFGSLTVIARDIYYEKGRTYYYQCLCDCGKYATVLKPSLMRGATKSCGCTSRVYERYNQWSNDEIQIVKDYYGKLDYSELLELLPKRGEYNVRKMAEKLGLTGSRQKYTYNHSYFSELTNENCYWAGFIAADGYVYTTKENQVGLKVVLQIRDKNHLEKLASCVEHTKPVQENVSSKGSGYVPQAAFNVYGCRQWLADLEQYFNIVQAKSLILQPPNLTETNHILSFLAGYIDGDGSIGYSTYKWKTNIRKGQLTISTLGTYDLLDWAKTQLETIVGPSKSNVHRHKGIWQYSISGERAERFKSTVLSMGLPILERKWLKEWTLPAKYQVKDQ